MPAVKRIRVGKRFGFECTVCRARELLDDAQAAKAARMMHVASPAHRSSLRAARRE